KSMGQIHEIRDKIFLAEQARWLTPVLGEWNSRPWQTIPLERIRESLASSEVVLEYVLAEPHSYCLVITNDSARITSLKDRASIESSVLGYLTTLKTKASSKSQGQENYTTIIKNIHTHAKKKQKIIVSNG